MSGEISPLQFYIGQALQGLLAARDTADISDKRAKQIAEHAVMLGHAVYDAERNAYAEGVSLSMSDNVD